MKNRFREMRETLGYSQDGLAELLELKKSPDSTNTNISKYERGISKPSAEVLEKLVTRCKTNLNWLLTGQGEMFLKEPEEIPTTASIDPHDEAMKMQHIEILKNLAKVGEKIDSMQSALQQRKEEIHEQPPDYGKKIIRIEEYLRTKLKKQRENPVPRKIEQYLHPTGTGAGAVSEDILKDAETESIIVPMPESADYGISVIGDSMEPVILDKSMVYFKKAIWQDVRNGDLVIYFDDEMKELKLRRASKIKDSPLLLAALNHTYNEITMVNDRLNLWGIVVYGDNKPIE